MEQVTKARASYHSIMPSLDDASSGMSEKRVSVSDLMKKQDLREKYPSYSLLFHALFCVQLIILVSHCGCIVNKQRWLFLLLIDSFVFIPFYTLLGICSCYCSPLLQLRPRKNDAKNIVSCVMECLFPLCYYFKREQ